MVETASALDPARPPTSPQASEDVERRAERLFEILRILRRRGGITAGELALRLGVSTNTIHRDIRALIASGMPIRRQVGEGYTLPGGSLPPLVLSAAELEALAQGAGGARRWADPRLQSALERILSHFGTVDEGAAEAAGDHLATLYRAVREERRLRLRYVDARGRASERAVRPLGLAFHGDSWLLLAWCEEREDFRTFRPDRMAEVELLAETFPREPGRTLDDFLGRGREPARRRPNREERDQAPASAP